ncbi:bacterial bifunctional deaminase-reductase [Bimuria novae-zelandiae CBS 107.79]|uniref:2,5-diamino-6-ribosylamino-4(3H)-pyrimidinone 5'-phosphate reductase n=1 Tax=Bimuria novae-zelandiae CBS 107.79 TaxID=1447943 RepID=A0A6A5UIP1_9PLEO|nr:bacterial bifunctional deaminase-reductase [Bimuria novae-zelandiae CBS 107.79]
MAQPTSSTLTFPAPSATLLSPYLPSTSSHNRPFLTLTYATSLDATLSLTPTTPTLLSGPLSKSMTHYLRAHHAAILIGAGTAIADDPSLNSRLEGAEIDRQPRPVVLDPRGRWAVGGGSKVVSLARQGRGLGPWVMVMEGVDVDGEKVRVVEGVGGAYVTLSTNEDGRFDWKDVLDVLWKEGVTSVMVEGGGVVINELLSPRYFGLVDAVIVTIAPVWLGREGVQVCPEERRDGEGKKVAVGRLRDVRWVPLGEDGVLCGRPKMDE